MEKLRRFLLVIRLPRDNERVSMSGDFEVFGFETRHSKGDAVMFFAHAADIVGRVAVTFVSASVHQIQQSVITDACAVEWIYIHISHDTFSLEQRCRVPGRHYRATFALDADRFGRPEKCFLTCLWSDQFQS
jgi:predicted Mrr-cat superfamily restriction endonuclease